ncbi:MAG TPA: asparagine synthase-related protein [Polyangiaceae bacterium]|nr:asparagine synthase-related protein [Polyangiaceae bacterium]
MSRQPAGGEPELWAVAARNERGRRRLAGGAPREFVRAARADAAAWWVDAGADVALLLSSPAGRPPGAATSLSVRGAPRVPGGGSLAAALRAGEAAALAGLRGPFALAHWCARRRRLVVARDHLGQRGLFVARRGDFFVFSSSLEGLLEGGAELDPESAIHYLAHGLPAPGKTLARDVERVPAGHLMWWEPGGAPQPARYWTPLRDGAPVDDTPRLRRSLGAAIEGALREGLAGPGRAGLLLSGGLDSSYLAAVARRAGARAGLASYSIEFDPAYGLNETEYATLAAGAFGLRHRAVRLGAREALAGLEEVFREAEPCSAWAALTHRALLRAAVEDGVTRLASGLGSDEIFGSYGAMLRGYAAFREHLVALPEGARGRALADLLPDREAARRVLYAGVATFFTRGALREALAPAYRAWDPLDHLLPFYRECLRLKPGAHAYELMVAHECQHRVPDLLHAGFEPASRRAGVRVCYPYLDPGFVERAAGLKASSRMRWGGDEWRTKLPLRALGAGLLPRAILERPRASYNAPFAHWMREPAFARPALSRLRSSRFWQFGLVRERWRGRVLRELSAEPPPAGAATSAWTSQLWALLTLAAWFDRFVERGA